MATHHERTLADFLHGPQLIYLIAHERFPAVDRIMERLREEWPAVRAEFLLQTSGSKRSLPVELMEADTIILFSSGALSLALEELRASFVGKSHPHLLVIEPDNSICRVRAWSENTDPVYSVVSAIKHRTESAAKRRLEQYESSKLKRLNERLQSLSLEDPLTHVFNRRGFYRFLHSEWSRASRQDAEMACVYVDIDRFKRINDTYGHKVGDQIIKRFAKTLRNSCRASDILGRLGGEEFCAILPGCNEHQAYLWAERVRRRIANMLIEARGKSLRVTASFGVAAGQAPLHDPEELIEHADQAMLVAKNTGRNRVVPANSFEGERKPENSFSPSSRVVRVLLDSLALRDPATYRHSHRVAQLATLLAKHVGLGENEVWVSELAGLLHDIGKIGLPDSLLQKSDRLDPKEMEIVRKSLESSSDIAKSVFGEGPLTDAIRSSRRWISDGGNETQRIPLPARIVAIADAFDAMTFPSAYRAGISKSAAIAELSRCSGTQFDSELVREFRTMIEENPEPQASS